MKKMLLLSLVFIVNSIIVSDSLRSSCDSIFFRYKHTLSENLDKSGFSRLNKETKLLDTLYSQSIHPFGVYMAIEYAVADFAKKHADEPELVKAVSDNKDLLLITILAEHPEALECLKEHGKASMIKTKKNR